MQPVTLAGKFVPSTFQVLDILLLGLEQATAKNTIATYGAKQLNNGILSGAMMPSTFTNSIILVGIFREAHH